MSKKKSIIRKLVETAKNNTEELFASLAIFIGLPVVAGLYFDYRASLLTVTLAIGIVSILALRSK